MFTKKIFVIHFVSKTVIKELETLLINKQKNRKHQSIILRSSAVNHQCTSIKTLHSKSNSWSSSSPNNMSDIFQLINNMKTLSINVNSTAVSKHLLINLYPYQMAGYEWMIKRETHSIHHQPLGGIIADEMGLGKTLQMIALMVHSHQSNIQQNKGLIASNATLIICPLSVVNHWEHEINQFVHPNIFNINKYHGSKRLKDAHALISAYNVIITTYGCVCSEYNQYYIKENERLQRIKKLSKLILDKRRKISDEILNNINHELKELSLQIFPKPVLHQIQWKRIILDEAHLVL